MKFSKLILVFILFSLVFIPLFAQIEEIPKVDEKGEVSSPNSTQAITDKIEFKNSPTNSILTITDEGNGSSSILIPPAASTPNSIGSKLYNKNGALYFGADQLNNTSSGSASGWTDAGTKIYNTTLTDNVGIGTNNPLSKLSIGGDGSSLYSFYSISTGSLGTAISGVSSGSGGTAFYGRATNTGVAINHGGYFEAAGENGRGIYGEATKGGAFENYGGYFKANGANGRGVYGLGNGLQGIGVYGETFTGVGVYGKATTGRSVFGSANGTGGEGVTAEAHGQNGRAISGYASDASGYAAYFSGRGFFSGNVGIGTNNPISNLSVGGDGTSGISIYSKTVSVDGEAIRGEAISDNINGITNYGGTFFANGQFGVGVYGTGSGTQGGGVYGGATGNAGRGVYAKATGISGRAIQAEAINTVEIGATNYGGYFTANGETGVAVYGEANNTLFEDEYHENYGGKFLSNGKHGAGVYAASTGASGYGVYAITHQYNGTGVHGIGSGESGRGIAAIASGTNGIAVEGNGNAYDFLATGFGVNYGSFSSKRWKNNIVEIDNPLEKIFKLRGVYFDWDEEHGGLHDIGMIAEEVGEVLPEIVVYEENGIDADGMDYSKLTPLLVEVAKAQQRLIEELENEVRELKKEINSKRFTSVSE